MNQTNKTRPCVLRRWAQMKREQRRANLREAKKNRVYYLFLLPFGIVFLLFYIVPVIISIVLSFTYYNVFEAPVFNGLKNYVNLFLSDDVNLIAIKNTFIIAAITGPIGYLASFLFAWLINELPRKLRAVAVVIFYAPAISGQVYLIWGIMFSGDAYGYVNAFLMNLGLIDAPVQWLTDPNYMMPVLLLVILWMSLGTGFLAFIAGLQGLDKSLIEAAYVDGIKNRWQELWYVVLPGMKPMLLFGAVMAITQSFGVADVTMNLAGFPSTDYAARTVVTHLIDYGSVRFDMGYASAIATMLFITMILSDRLVRAILNRVGK